MFYEPHQFNFVSLLELNWLTIKNELIQLRQGNFIPWPEPFLYGGKGWDVFGFHAYGRKLNNNCRLCPETTRLVEAIPGMTTAGFSVLAPGRHIAPHIGFSNAVLRCHLGLIVPDGCAIRVGTEIRHWQEGKCLIFEDTVEHEAWNRGNSIRVVLLIDVKKPGVVYEVKPPAHLAKYLNA